MSKASKQCNSTLIDENCNDNINIFGSKNIVKKINKSKKSVVINNDDIVSKKTESNNDIKLKNDKSKMKKLKNNDTSLNNNDVELENNKSKTKKSKNNNNDDNTSKNIKLNNDTLYENDNVKLENSKSKIKKSKNNNDDNSISKNIKLNNDENIKSENNKCKTKNNKNNDISKNNKSKMEKSNNNDNDNIISKNFNLNNDTMPENNNKSKIKKSNKILSLNENNNVNNINFDENKNCTKCKQIITDINYKPKVCERCKINAKANYEKRKIANPKIKCIGYSDFKIFDNNMKLIHKPCKFNVDETSDHNKYCKDHQNFAIKKSLEINGINACVFWSLGCFNSAMSNDKYSKCNDCSKNYKYDDMNIFNSSKNDLLTTDIIYDENVSFECSKCRDKVHINTVTGNKCEKCQQVQTNSETRRRIKSMTYDEY